MTTVTVEVSGHLLRRCWSCLRWLPLITGFYRERRDAYGRTRTCTDCGRRRSLEYRHANLDRVRRRDRERHRSIRAAEIERFLRDTATHSKTEETSQ